MSTENNNLKIIKFLNLRGLCFQSTIENFHIKNVFQGSFYFGVDPSGHKIHLGHIQNILLAQQLSKLEMNMVLVIGTFTGEIGDPSLKQVTRKEIDSKTIISNTTEICLAFKYILNRCQINYQILYNNEWLSTITLREYINIAKLFNLKTILNSKIFETRQQSNNPMYMHELTYFVMQAYDFMYLHKKYKCNIQIGGQDQWINMTSGCTLIRNCSNTIAHVITTPLLTDPQNNKIGKTSKNSHIYFIDFQKSFIFTYINLYNLPENIINHFAKIFDIKDQDNIRLNTVKQIFLTIYSNEEYKLAELLFKKNITTNNKNNIQIQYTNIIDCYNSTNYNIKVIIKKFTNIEKSHHITDAIKSKSIIINDKNIKTIKEFYDNTLENQINIIEVSNYIYIYIYNK